MAAHPPQKIRNSEFGIRNFHPATRAIAAATVILNSFESLEADKTRKASSTCCERNALPKRHPELARPPGRANRTTDDNCWQKLKVGQGPPYLGTTDLQKFVGWASAHLQGLASLAQDKLGWVGGSSIQHLSHRARRWRRRRARELESE